MDSKQTQTCACCMSSYTHATPPHVASDLEKASPINPPTAPLEHHGARRRMPSRALILWVMLWTAAATLTVYNKGSRYFGKPVIADNVPECQLGAERTFDYEYDSDHDCTQSAEWTHGDDSSKWPHDDFEHHAYLTYTLPQSSDLLSFISKGSLSLGKIDFVDAGKDEKDVSYNVTIGYRTENALEKVKVCKLHEGSDNGVGIFTPKFRTPVPDEDRVFFLVEVKLPSAKYRAFTTDLLQFTQYFNPLNPPIEFDSVTLKSVNAPIYVQSLLTKTATVSNANGAIWGAFNATDSLKFSTANANIQVAVYLTHSGAVDVANLTMTNANGLISSDIFLYTPTDSKHNGKYNVVAQNGNSPNQLRFRDAPVDSVLNVTSETAMAESYVKLHETFEGMFTLKSTPFQTPVVDMPNGKVEDPAGKNRERRVKFSEAGSGTVKGVVSWVGDDGEDDEKEVGNVKISTAFGEAKLVL